MGIDFLDCCIRIEREFALERWDLNLEKLHVPRTARGTMIGATAADISRWVETCLTAKSREVPPDLWARFDRALPQRSRWPRSAFRPAVGSSKTSASREFADRDAAAPSPAAPH